MLGLKIILVNKRGHWWHIYMTLVLLISCQILPSAIPTHYWWGPFESIPVQFNKPNFYFKNIHLNKSSAKCESFSSGLSVLKAIQIVFLPIIGKDSFSSAGRGGSVAQPSGSKSTHQLEMRVQLFPCIIDKWPNFSTRLRVYFTRWCHQIKTFAALLALCAENSPVINECP